MKDNLKEAYYRSFGTESQKLLLNADKLSEVAEDEGLKLTAKSSFKDGLLHLLVKYPNDLYHNGLNLTLVSKTDNAKEEPLNIKLKLTSGQELDVSSHDNVINIYSGEREEVSVQYDYTPLEEISEILVNGTVISVT